MTDLEPVAPISNRDRERAEVQAALRAKVHAAMRERGHFDQPPLPTDLRNPRKVGRLALAIRRLLGTHPGRNRRGKSAATRTQSVGPKR